MLKVMWAPFFWRMDVSVRDSVSKYSADLPHDEVQKNIQESEETCQGTGLNRHTYNLVDEGVGFRTEPILLSALKKRDAL
jgi:hypothetical protein